MGCDQRGERRWVGAGLCWYTLRTNTFIMHINKTFQIHQICWHEARDKWPNKRIGLCSPLGLKQKAWHSWRKTEGQPRWAFDVLNSTSRANTSTGLDLGHGALWRSCKTCGTLRSIIFQVQTELHCDLYSNITFAEHMEIVISATLAFVLMTAMTTEALATALASTG